MLEAERGLSFAKEALGELRILGGSITLRATLRLAWTSVARNTMAMPPSPIFFSTTYPLIDGRSSAARTSVLEAS